MEIKTTETFDSWLTSLRDKNAKARILTKLRYITIGNLGHYRSIGEFNELKIDYGQGYRVYF